MEKITQTWSCRNLSLKGRITIMKTLVIPQISNVLSMCYCPLQILEKIDQLLFDFLWEKKPHKIKRETIIANFNSGGLRMPDIFSIHTVAKLKWITRLLTDLENEKWTSLTWYMLNIDKYIINRKIPLSCKNKCKTAFYSQVLERWHKIKSRPPKNIEEIQNEYIFNNMHINSRARPLEYIEFKIEKKVAINIQVKNLLDDEGRFLDFQAAKKRLQWNICIFNYNRILSAIPSLWKKKLKGSSTSMNMYNEVVIRVRKSLIDITELTNKDIYWEIIDEKVKEPTSLNTWLNLFPFLEGINWKKIFLAVHHICPEIYFQSFQYKIINRVLNCNYNLYKWKIKEQPFCNFCSHVDTIEHHLYLCAHSKLFWEDLHN